MPVNGSLSNLGLQGIFSAAMAPGTYAKNRRAGENPVLAGAHTAQDTAFVTLAMPMTYVAGQQVVPTLLAAYRGAKRASTNVRQAATPFSQRFEHTQATMALQNYALGQMGAMRGVGSEAALMYGRFGR